MQIIDTHSHLYLNKFKDDIDLVIQRAKENHVSKILLPNIDIESSKDLLDLYKRDTNFFSPMMGIHPTSIRKEYQKDLETVLAEENLKDVCAIGEIGLDFYWSKDLKKEQIDAFIYQIQFAKKRNLPIAIHCREAFPEVLEILEQCNDNTLNGVLHCFTGNLQQAQKLIEMDFYLGIGGVITYKNSGLDKVVSQLDIKHLVVETDSPFLPPVPYRGKRNESSYIANVVDKLADVLRLSSMEVAEQTTKNAIELFSL